MESRELRIGNWVNRIESTRTGERLGIVKWDEMDWYSIGECIDHLDNYEPVPLTEEWLNKTPEWFRDLIKGLFMIAIIWLYFLT